MKRLGNLKRCALLMAALCVMAISPLLITSSAMAASATTKTAATPDPATNPVLAGILKLGTKAYYMGTRSGMNGWFLVKDGQIQIVYSTPDNQNIIMGAIFGPNGDNITADQVKNLVASNKEVSNLVDNAASSLLTNSLSAANSATPTSPTAPPGEKLIQDLSAAAGVTVGSGTPQLFMVMDPNCLHCQATWKVLRDAVLKNAIQIRMIPIGSVGTDNERAAAQFLHVADPLSTWDKYVAGDKSQLAGAPDLSLIAAVRANYALINSWNIRETPYLVYRGKDGKVKILQGEPQQAASVLSDLVP